MSRDVTFYGQWTMNRGQQGAWRRRRVGASSLRGWRAPFRGRVEPFEVAALIDDAGDEFAVESTARSLRLAGMVEAGTFWESWGRELAGLMVEAAKAGHAGWLVVEDDDRCFRLVSDGQAASQQEPSASLLRRARRSPAHALLDKLSFGLSKAEWAEVEAAADAAVSGTNVDFVTTGGVEDVFAMVEAADEAGVKAALAKADDVPCEGTFEKPKTMFKSKAALLEAARKAKKIEHRAVGIEVASHLDPELCAERCLPWLTKKKVPPGLRAAAARALGRATSDEALEGLLALVYQKASSEGRNDPVCAALYAVADSPHPRAAERMLEAMPKLKGKRRYECFSRAAYVTVAQPAPQLRDYFQAIADDEDHEECYTAEAVVSCLQAGHTGALIDGCFGT